MTRNQFIEKFKSKSNKELLNNFMKKVFVKYFLTLISIMILTSFALIKLKNPMLKVEKEFKEIQFFDCKKTQKIEIGKEYWFGETSAIDFMKSYITFINNNKEIKIYCFVQRKIPKQINKYLSTFQSPRRGFSLLDLENIAENLNLPKPKLDNQESYIKDVYPYELMYKVVDNKEYIMIYSIFGGRNPEGIKILKVLEINMEPTIRKKYFNDTFYIEN